MTVQELETLVQSKKVHQIRCGDHRFIDITIVATEGRFFVRQYKFRKRSWYDAFLVNPEGAMKIGDLEVEIKGVVPDDIDQVNPKVNKAYRKLLGLIYPAMRLTYDTKKHEASTLELVPTL
ncbi:hypothetical protein WH52_01425 [Tenacibaculum holothuriorum]|uniref:DUF2255 domain-containing protein n=1 Tax=Tenacibaculum holothuriorum TaxID=1635173 RepID=A0A1Y2PHR3_9FLAO|nr:DUF2255 family protein [Tenacibaculum holothuriorum]OSY89327.1 hypothetical protein WH52_01425 [Tenacibaculum holothuriorum]